MPRLLGLGLFYYEMEARMSSSNRLGLRVKPNDEAVLQKLSEHLERNWSDTVRFALRYTARHYGLLPKKKPSNATKVKEGSEE